jgi:hypothetical protein
VHTLKHLLAQLHLAQLQHGHGPIGTIYETLVQVQPLLVIAAAAAAYLCLVYMRRNLYAIPAAILLCYFGLLFGLPGGKAVIANAATHPLIEQPRCLLDATLAGAIWDKSKLGGIHSCLRISGKPSGAVTDDAKDGSLTGIFDGPHLVAKATVAETPPWTAITIPEGGMRVIYFSLGGAADRLSACPDVTGAVPAAAIADKSGRAFTAAFAAGADRSLLAQLFPGATGFGPADASGRYQVLAHGAVVAYLLPVSGARGDCAFLAPYAQITADEWRLVDHPSAPDLAQLGQIANTLHLDGLTVVTLKSGR